MTLAERPLPRRGVFLDRDGVLNRARIRDGRPYPPRDVSEAELLPDALAACRQLKAAGAVLVVVTNQPEVRRGTAEAESVHAINAWLRAHLPVDDIGVCLHDDADHCDCRKPKPGLLVQAAADHGLDLPSSIMVGDRWRDVGAGQQAGCRTVFIDRNYAERQPESPDLTVSELGDAVPWIIERLHEEHAT